MTDDSSPESTLTETGVTTTHSTTGELIITRDFAAPRELVGSEEFIGVPGVQEPTTMTMRLEFHDADGGGTRLVIQRGPYTPELEPMAKAGWESSFTKLDALLAA